jgi:hypothetical protein
MIMHKGVAMTRRGYLERIGGAIFCLALGIHGLWLTGRMLDSAATPAVVAAIREARGLWLAAISIAALYIAYWTWRVAGARRDH